jgi:ABC-type phosphate transport system substrate-binding protein
MKMKKQHNILLLVTPVVIALFFKASPSLAQNPDDILVVANLKAPVDKIDVKELKAIYLKKKLYWRAGQDVIPVNSKYGTALRAEFQRRVLGMEPETELIYWERQKIQRALSPPPEFPQTQKAVFKLRNSVSYVFRKDYRPNVTKVLLEIPSK